MLKLVQLPGRSVRLFCCSCKTRMSKKDLTDVFPSKYSPSLEEGWYRWWKASGFFSPRIHMDRKRKPGEKSRFSMVLPPPNVTGVLHLGHALTATIQDSLVRYHRMRGCETVWVPGSDHAGIATQVVVEKHLMAKEGLTRHDLGREEFVKRVWDWKKEKGDRILRQLEDLGASLDWERTQFTLSKEFTESVDQAFITLFNKGIIYRKESLINWSCVLQSTISDIEVSHVQVEKRTLFDVPGSGRPVEFGVLCNFAYKVTGSEEEIVVSTTRPETMLGDTAVAVNPEDERYQHLVGKSVWHPFRREEIPIIADAHVDPQFGTGAVKITPAHDQNDFEIGQRHQLKRINILNEDGTLNQNGCEFSGLQRFTVRESICSRLEELGLYRGDTDNAMSIPVCGRTGDVVEPMLKYQWFIDTDKIGEMANRAVKDKDILLNPNLYDAVWENFLGKNSNRDWCISRQLWWGHRIPAWFCYKEEKENEGVWIAAVSQSEAIRKAAENLGCSESTLKAEQDPDVLDTWFSSGLYPFAVFGWPSRSEDVEKFFPLDLMETGHDILFFWVARMVMLSIALLGKLPFPEVMLHGIICDQQGRKMSKSLGNVIDPMHIIHGASKEELLNELDTSAKNGYLSQEEVEASKTGILKNFPTGISRSGADPLRWALLSYDVKSQQINLDVSLINRAGAWCNKILQVNKFLFQAHQKAEEAGKSLSELPKDFKPSIVDMWILNQLANTVKRVNDGFEERNLHVVLKEIRGFLYGDVCDVFVEYIKPELQNVDNPEFLPSLLFLHTCILSSLKLIHPIMPFITEELYQRLPKLPNEKRKESIMLENFPQAMEWSGFLNKDLENLVEEVLRIVSGVRGMKSNYSLKKGSNPSVSIHCENWSISDLNHFRKLVQRLTRCGDVEFLDSRPDLESLQIGCVVSAIDNTTIILNLGSALDTEKEVKKLQEKIAKNARDRVKLDKSLKGNFKFRESAETVAEKKKLLDEELQKLEQQLKIMQGLKSD